MGGGNDKNDTTQKEDDINQEEENKNDTRQRDDLVKTSKRRSNRIRGGPDKYNGNAAHVLFMILIC